jgi:hypothetical protein
VDFGADNAYGGDNDSQTSFSLNESSLETETWISVDVPLSGLANRQNLAQLVLDGNENFNTVYIDNVYFYIGEETGGSSEPEEAAPTPSLDASDVISIFSDAYTDVPVDNWITEWSSATFEDATVEGNAVKKYSGLDFVGIETTTSTVDASEMTHFHIDVWSANFTSFSIKLVDFGPDGVFEGGDDTEHQLDFTSPTQEEWVSYDILLSDFTDLTTTAHIAQYILVAQPAGAATIFVDNMYFHK